jgi:hypothetical protein
VLLGDDAIKGADDFRWGRHDEAVDDADLDEQFGDEEEGDPGGKPDQHGDGAGGALTPGYGGVGHDGPPSWCSA